MRKTRNWKHTTKFPKQYGNRESERTAWNEIMLSEEVYFARHEEEETS